MGERQLLNLKSAARNIATKVLKLPGKFMWSLKMEAIKLCLYVYGYMPSEAVCEDVVGLAHAVEAKIRTIIINWTWSGRLHSSERFGCSYQDGYKKEIDVSVIVTF